MILTDDPTHHGPRAPALNIGGESIMPQHFVVDRHFLWPGKLSK